MTTINLKDFYPWYTHDEYIEVSEEVADELRASRLYEAAYQRRIVRNKAQYSLDCEDGIEYSACISEPTPQELLERYTLQLRLYAAMVERQLGLPVSEVQLYSFCLGQAVPVRL